MAKAKIVATFQNNLVTTGVVVVRKRNKPPTGAPPANVESHNMTKAGTTYTAEFNLPDGGKGKKLLLRVVGKDAAGNELVSLDVPPRNHSSAPPKKKP